MEELSKILSKMSPKILGFTVAFLGIGIWWVYTRLFGKPTEAKNAEASERPIRRVEISGMTDPAPDPGSPGELTQYEKLLSQSPDDPDLLYNCGACLAEFGKYTEACESFTKSLDLALPPPDPSAGRGNTLGKLLSGDRSPYPLPELALHIEAFLLQLRPSMQDDPTLLHGLATLARLQDRDEDALVLYKRILQISPGDEVATIYRNLNSMGTSEES